MNALGCFLLVGLMGCGGESPRRGGVGETCRARNDCGSGMLCIREVCVLDNSSIPTTSKSCERVECSTESDCCESFVPDPGCADYEAACNADPNDCLTFESLCRCNAACVDSLCVDTSPECDVDAHCPWFDRDLCADHRCVECKAPADCEDSSNLCVDGVCVPRCSSDAQCDLLEQCVDGVCVESGCSSDRECWFLLSTPNARCVDATCEATCTSDAECDLGAFETCRGGRCTFVGCENDEECRIYLDIANEDANVSAVCR